MAPTNKAKSQASKLEFVNWVYNEDEIGQRRNKDWKKRDNNNYPPAPSNEFLDEYLLNRSFLSENELDISNNNNNDDDNEQDDKLSNFHKDVDTMMADKRFKEVVSNNRQAMAAYLSPVVLIPGLLGSRLQARTNKTNRVNILCSKQSDWQDLWLSVKNFLPLIVDCWLDNVRLEYDPETGWTKPPNGVESRVPDFGSVESVRHLDLRQPKLTGYFNPLIERYEKLGYTPDRNLLAAPYDFRLAPQQMNEYFKDLKQLIERAQSESPSGKKVTLVCHSMGCTHLLVFLRLQSAAWRQNRIRKMVALSSPWGGATKALKAIVAGDQLNLPLVGESKIRKLARNYPSIAFLLPQAEIYERSNGNQAEKGGVVLVQTPERKYRAANLGELMRDLNLTRQFNWYQKTSSLIKPLEPLPDLHVDCIHSLNVPTPETLIFRTQSDFPNGEYELIKGEGDGTVNFESLMVCEDWAKQLPEKVKHKIIMNTNHNGVLSHKITLTHITDDVLTN